MNGKKGNQAQTNRIKIIEIETRHIRKRLKYIRLKCIRKKLEHLRKNLRYIRIK